MRLLLSISALALVAGCIGAPSEPTSSTGLELGSATTRVTELVVDLPAGASHLLLRLTSLDGQGVGARLLLPEGIGRIYSGVHQFPEVEPGQLEWAISAIGVDEDGGARSSWVSEPSGVAVVVVHLPEPANVRIETGGDDPLVAIEVLAKGTPSLASYRSWTYLDEVVLNEYFAGANVERSIPTGDLAASAGDISIAGAFHDAGPSLSFALAEAWPSAGVQAVSFEGEQYGGSLDGPGVVAAPAMRAAAMGVTTGTGDVSLRMTRSGVDVQPAASLELWSVPFPPSHGFEVRPTLYPSGVLAVDVEGAQTCVAARALRCD